MAVRSQLKSSANCLADERSERADRRHTLKRHTLKRVVDVLWPSALRRVPSLLTLCVARDGR